MWRVGRVHIITVSHHSYSSLSFVGRVHTTTPLDGPGSCQFCDVALGEERRAFARGQALANVIVVVAIISVCPSSLSDLSGTGIRLSVASARPLREQLGARHARAASIFLCILGPARFHPDAREGRSTPETGGSSEPSRHFGERQAFCRWTDSAGPVCVDTPSYSSIRRTAA